VHGVSHLGDAGLSTATRLPFSAGKAPGKRCGGTGNSATNVITGNDGNNSLSGAAGVDTFVGGAGDDSLIGGTGNDSMTGGLGNDTFVAEMRSRSYG
jgi:Ca2+-binding RTX toxin-like protein